MDRRGMDLGPDGEHWQFHWRWALSVFCVVFILTWIVWPWLDTIGLLIVLGGLRVMWWLAEAVCQT